MKPFKVLIVGAGISGLTAAALLARRGMKVTLLERCDRPGGSCSAFRRNDVTFDIGAAMLYGFGERGFNPHRWLMSVLEEPIDVYRHEALYRLHYGEKPVTFWPDIDRFVGELAEVFPAAKAEIGEFYRHIIRLYERVISKVTVFEAPGDMPMIEMGRRMGADIIPQLEMISLLFRNTESLMKPYIHDPEVRKFFDKLTSTYCYTTLEETPAVLSATMFSDNHKGGAFYPAGSAMSLAARLEKAVEKFGGSILYRKEVVALQGSNGKVTGVRTRQGEIHEGDAVVLASALLDAALNLDPEGVLPAKWKRKVLNLEQSMPSFVVYGTVARAILPSGMMPVEMFIDNRENLDESDVTLYLPGLEDRGLAPESRVPFQLIGPSLLKWPKPGDSGDGTTEYRQSKTKEGDRMLALVERRVPGFMASIEDRVEGSPTTIERYLRKPGGSVAGPKQKMGQHLIFRQGSRGPVPGLFFAGEATVMGTGTPAVTVSGISVANRILRSAGYRPFDTNEVLKPVVRVIPRGARGNIPESEQGRMASRCRWCEKPSCSAACPFGADIPGIMRRLEANNISGAIGALYAAGIGPETCSACRKNGGMDKRPPCEKACIVGGDAERALPIARIFGGLDATLRG